MRQLVPVHVYETGEDSPAALLNYFKPIANTVSNVSNKLSYLAWQYLYLLREVQSDVVDIYTFNIDLSDGHFPIIFGEVDKDRIVNYQDLMNHGYTVSDRCGKALAAVVLKDVDILTLPDAVAAYALDFICYANSFNLKPVMLSITLLNTFCGTESKDAAKNLIEVMSKSDFESRTYKLVLHKQDYANFLKAEDFDFES